MATEAEFAGCATHAAKAEKDKKALEHEVGSLSLNFDY